MFQAVIALAAAGAQFISTPPVLDVDPALARRMKSGVEYLTLETNTSGAIIGCHVRISDGSAYEDARNCKRLQKLKATPATDQSGQASYSKDIVVMIAWGGFDPRRLRWSNPNSIYLEVNRLPDGIHSDAITHVMMVVSTSGKIETCDVSGSSGNSTLDTLACKTALSSSTEALRDASGVPVRSVQGLDVGFVPKV